MEKNYWIQVNDYMEPVKVALTKEEAKGVEKVLKQIEKEDPDSLIQMTDESGDVVYVDNYNEWSKTHK